VKRFRGPQWMLILLFLGIIASVPLIQTAIEIRRGEWPQALEVLRRKPSVANLRAYEQNLEDASWASRQARPQVQFAQFEWLGDGGEKALIGLDGWLFYRPGLDYLVGRPAAAEVPGGTNDPLPAILAFRDELAARGIRLLVVPAPNKESIYPDKLTRRAARLRGVLGSQTRALLARLRDANVEVVDLFDAFAVARRNEGAPAQAPLYLAQDTHWSPAGIDLAAKAVAQRLRELGWVKTGTTKFETKPAPVERLGDVLRMLQVPEIERRAIPETIPCNQVYRRGLDQLYQDDPNSEVLVLGDSFLRIYQQDEPGAAGFIAHLARELGQPVTSLVNDGGASTLVRQELHRRPALLKNKAVVVWEFVERDIRLGTEGWQIVPLPPRA